MLIEIMSFVIFHSVVRHRAASEGPIDVTDKFRIDVSVDRKLIGRKQILSKLVKKLEVLVHVLSCGVCVCFSMLFVTMVESKRQS